MRQTKFLFVMMLALVLSNAVVSCKKDPAPQEKKTVENPELATKLKALGFQVEGDVITIDDKVMNSTSLDLSGAGLSDLAGLEVFPKLEEVNLSNNNFGDTFDFAQLPKNVTSVNLADNDIYKYKGLATVSDEGFAVQKQLKKLVLPASARFNVELLPYYYKETKGKTTLQMQNPETKAIEDYTTLRNIPDENFRNFLKNIFPSVMTENGQIDLGKKLSGEDSKKDFITFMFFGVQNLDGAQYIINRPEYRPSSIIIAPPGKLEVPYLIIPEACGYTGTFSANAKLDFSRAKDISFVRIENNPSLEVLDLTHCKKILDAPLAITANQLTRSAIVAYNCENLTEIKLAKEGAKNSIHGITLIKLPKLTSFNTDRIIGVNQFSFSEIPNANFDMPDIQQYTDLNGNLEEDGSFNLAITKDVLENNPKIKAFIIKYGKLNRIGRWDGDLNVQYKIEPYDYTSLYK